MNTIKYFGLNMVSAGIVNPPDGSYEVIASKRGNIYKKVVDKDGVVVGMVFAGDIETSGIIYNLMKNRVNVDAFKEVLVAEGFGLASLPDSVWRPLLTIPPAERDVSVTSLEPPEEVFVGE